MAADTESPGKRYGDNAGSEEDIGRREPAPEKTFPPEVPEVSTEALAAEEPKDEAPLQFEEPNTAPDTPPDFEHPSLGPQTGPELDPPAEPEPITSATEAQPLAWSLPEESAREEWEHWPSETANPDPEPVSHSAFDPAFDAVEGPSGQDEPHADAVFSGTDAPGSDISDPPASEPAPMEAFPDVPDALLECPQDFAASESAVPSPLDITPIEIRHVATPPVPAEDQEPRLELAAAPLPPIVPPSAVAPPPPIATADSAPAYIPPPPEPAAQTSAGTFMFPPLTVPSIDVSPPAATRRRFDRARLMALANDALRFAAYAVAGYLSLVVVLIGLYRFVDPPGSTLMLFRWLAGTEIDHRWVPLEQISPQLVRAVVVAEDGRFCDHWGIDFDAMEDAIEQAVDGLPRGASTISMQVVKNVFLWPSKSYVRKILELPLTVLAELVWPKRRMLEIYLNVAEWGPGVFGAEAAAQHHFNRSAARLNEREAALLAASLPNPVRRDAGDPGPLTARKASVIQARMRAAGPVSCVSIRE